MKAIMIKLAATVPILMLGVGLISAAPAAAHGPSSYGTWWQHRHHHYPHWRSPHYHHGYYRPPPRPYYPPRPHYWGW